ncbi:MAG: LytR/AlgR family response regulator transcription factor [Cyclobacteriaceae bacterium]
MKVTNPVKEQTQKMYHPEVVIFLICIPFISAINYYLTYSNIKLGGFLILTFSIDTAQGYLAWWFVRKFIFFLDGKWPYITHGAKRIALQIVGTMAIGLTVIALTTELVSLIAKGKPALPSFYSIDLFIIGIWFFVINGIYIGLYYYNLWQQTIATKQHEQKNAPEGLLAKNGKQELLITYEDIFAIAVDQEYVVAHLQNKKKYYLDQSLDKLEMTLPSHSFFRLNRQTIIHRQVVSGFKREENGKINVILKPNDFLPTEIMVSRIKAPAFKVWFRP